MAHATWNVSNDIDKIHNNPGAWNFFQAMRRVECENASLPRVGCAMNPDNENFRLGQKATLAFTPNDISSFTDDQLTGIPNINVNCFGLLGSNGSVPLFLTEYIYQRIKHKNDNSLIDFINMFQHRLTSLLYRAWALYESTVSADRKEDDYVLGIPKNLT